MVICIRFCISDIHEGKCEELLHISNKRSNSENTCETFLKKTFFCEEYIDLSSPLIVQHHYAIFSKKYADIYMDSLYKYYSYIYYLAARYPRFHN